MLATVKNNCIIIHKLNLPSTFALALPVTAEYNGNKIQRTFPVFVCGRTTSPISWDICTLCGTLHFVYTLVTLVKSNYPENK